MSSCPRSTGREGTIGFYVENQCKSLSSATVNPVHALQLGWMVKTVKLGMKYLSCWVKMKESNVEWWWWSNAAPLDRFQHYHFTRCHCLLALYEPLLETDSYTQCISIIQLAKVSYK